MKLVADLLNYAESAEAIAKDLRTAANLINPIVTDKMVEAAVKKADDLDKSRDNPWWMDDYLRSVLPELFKTMLEAKGE